jgi:hypothetical protein
MKTFIRVVEFWIPSADRSLLEFRGGYFGDAARFAAASAPLCFGKGEGLPGRVWETGHPEVLKELSGSYFRRSGAAQAAGLTCGIALPIYQGEALSAVAVIFCGDDAEHAGAIELWCNDPAESKDMTLVDGYYGNTGDTFEFISRSTAFRIGNGLPGMAWQQQKPVFLTDLGRGSGFLRADSAVKVGINAGFAIPCSTRDGSNYVIAFLSALATPIARQVDYWTPAAGGGGLQRSAGLAPCTEPLTPADPLPLDSQAAAARAFASGVPVAEDNMIALPIAPQGRITSVMAMHF